MHTEYRSDKHMLHCIAKASFYTVMQRQRAVTAYLRFQAYFK